MRTPRHLAALVAALSALVGAVATAPVAAAAQGQPPPDVAVVAHRGSGAMAPENTLASVRLALQQGADYIENDIMRTKDGALVIMHDLTLTRTTDDDEVRRRADVQLDP